MRLMYAFFIVSLVSIISADIFLRTPRLPAKLPPVVVPVAKPHEETEIKAATPEDPGPTATVVSPLTVLTKTSADTPAPAAAPPAISLADHVAGTALPGPNHFLHGQFTVTNSSEFAFSVPPHVVNPVLRGGFRAFAKSSLDSTSPTPANVDMVLMNDRQFADFTHGRPCDATFDADSSSNQTVNYAMPPTHDQEERYHLVFQRTGTAGAIVVKADFTVSFQ